VNFNFQNQFAEIRFYLPYLALILGILQVNPQKRMTIKQIKDRPWFKRKNPFMNSELQCGNALELSKRIGVKLEVANMEVETAQPEGSACIIS